MNRKVKEAGAVKVDVPHRVGIEKIIIGGLSWLVVVNVRVKVEAAGAAKRGASWLVVDVERQDRVRQRSRTGNVQRRLQRPLSVSVRRLEP